MDSETRFLSPLCYLLRFEEEQGEVLLAPVEAFIASHLYPVPSA